MPAQQGTRGVLLGVLAYGSWGLFPIYWKQLQHVPATEVLSHRIVGSLGFVLLLLWGTKRFGALRHVLRSAETRRLLLGSTVLIAINWGLFIWAVTSGRILDASLGYYINPLFNVALGRVVLGERLTRMGWAAVAIATLGVCAITVSRGELPWVSLVLASTFSVYGLLRKRMSAGALEGLAVECGLSTPIALLFLLSLDPPLGSLATGSTGTQMWLLGAGLATAIPLLAFAGAARRLRYVTLGILQFIAPSMQLGCAVLLYDEPFDRPQQLAFSLIWIAVALYAQNARREQGARNS